MRSKARIYGSRLNCFSPSSCPPSRSRRNRATMAETSARRARRMLKPWGIAIASQHPGWPRLQPSEPTCHVDAVGRYFEARQAHELDGKSTGDVGDGERLPANIGRAGKVGVEFAQFARYLVLVGFAPAWDLRDFKLGHERVEVPEDHGDAEEESQLHSS